MCEQTLMSKAGICIIMSIIVGTSILLFFMDGESSATRIYDEGWIQEGGAGHQGSDTRAIVKVSGNSEEQEGWELIERRTDFNIYVWTEKSGNIVCHSQTKPKDVSTGNSARIRGYAGSMAKGKYIIGVRFSNTYVHIII